MKFKTFRVFVIGALGVTTVGVLVSVSTCCKKDESAKAPPKTEAPVATVEKTAKPADKPAATATADEPKGDGLSLRPMDKEILDRLAQPTASDKVKDAFPGRAYKVNLYKENGATKVNRLKIDLDRDEKWDEKWSIDQDDGQETIKRQVAPADDEKYTDEYRLKAGAWVPKKK